MVRIWISNTPLKIVCSVLSWYGFVVAPLVLFVIGPYPSWQFLLIGLGIITAVVAVMFYRIHLSLYPQCAYDRWTQAASMALLPVAAIRCLDKLSRDTLVQYNPLIVASVLSSPASSTPLIRRQVIDLGSDLGSIEVGNTQRPVYECAEWFRQILVSEIPAALQRAKVAVFEAPNRHDATMTFYCPRCHAQYGPAASDLCSQCPETRLAKFDLQEPAPAAVAASQ